MTYAVKGFKDYWVDPETIGPDADALRAYHENGGRLDSQSAPRIFPCSFCDAAAGEECQTRQGTPASKNHQPRLRRATRAGFGPRPKKCRCLVQRCRCERIVKLPWATSVCDRCRKNQHVDPSQAFKPSKQHVLDVKELVREASYNGLRVRCLRCKTRLNPSEEAVFAHEYAKHQGRPQQWYVAGEPVGPAGRLVFPTGNGGSGP